MKAATPDTPSSLRRFGLTVGLGLVIIAAISRYRGHEWAPLALACLATPLILLALVRPQLLAGTKKAWMGFGNVLGWINTRIILTCLFVVVVSPLSVLVRIFRDPLDRRTEANRRSYWLPKAEPAVTPPAEPRAAYPPRYERQF